MSRSISAKVMSELLKLWPKYTEEQCEQRFEELLREGEKPCPPPKLLKTRHEDNENGRIFYVNEDPESPYVIFYIHGGGYHYDIVLPHWQLIEKLARKTGAQVVVPTYRLVPFACYREAYDLIVPEYRKYAEACPDKKIILMGDSAGGGLSLALTEYFKLEGIRLPDELILFSPWVDISMENEDIKKFLPRDPLVTENDTLPAAKGWAGDRDIHDPLVSPIYGDLKGIHNVTVFIGTEEALYPDAVKMFHMLDQDVSNELIVGEGMIHCYPLNPVEEAIHACHKVFHIVMR